MFPRDRILDAIFTLRDENNINESEEQRALAVVEGELPGRCSGPAPRRAVPRRAAPLRLPAALSAHRNHGGEQWSSLEAD